MNPQELLTTVYLGDRCLKRIIIDSWCEKVILQIDSISRIAKGAKNWDFYADEDIEEGMIVFTGVKFISFDPPEYIPNDAIEITAIDTISGDLGLIIFTISTTSVYSDSGEVVNKDVIIKITATGVHLEDPKYSEDLVNRSGMD